MKAILVLDMPKNCAECKLVFLQGIGEAICNAVDWEERPSLCPLRPMPKRYEYRTDTRYYTVKYNTGYADGWNACLDEITGETE